MTCFQGGFWVDISDQSLVNTRSSARGSPPSGSPREFLWSHQNDTGSWTKTLMQRPICMSEFFLPRLNDEKVKGFEVQDFFRFHLYRSESRWRCLSSLSKGK